MVLSKRSKLISTVSSTNVNETLALARSLPLYIWTFLNTAFKYQQFRTVWNNFELPGCQVIKTRILSISCWAPGQLPQSWKKLGLNRAYGVSGAIWAPKWVPANKATHQRLHFFHSSAEEEEASTNYSAENWLSAAFALSVHLLNSLICTRAFNLSPSILCT